MRLLQSVPSILFGLLIIFFTNQIANANNQITDQLIFDYINKAQESRIKDVTQVNLASQNPNVYLSISKFFMSDAERLVYQMLSDEFTISESDVVAVVKSNKQIPNLNNDNVRARYEQASKDLKTVQKNKIDTFAKEAFMNNSTEDSFFDLIIDLNDLEQVLFNSQSEILLDGMSIPQNLTGLPAGFSNVPTPSNPSQTQADPNPDQPTPPDDQAEAPEDNLDPTLPNTPSVISQSETSSCDADPELTQQLENIQPPAVDTSSGSNPSDSQNTNPQDNPQSNQPPSSPNPESDPQATNGPVSSQNNTTTPLGFSDYPTMEFECEEDQMFCLSVEEVMGRFGLVIPADQNCLACKVSQIKAAMNQILAVNLLPQKVTGNIGEFPFCKEELKKSLIVFNFKILSKPLRPTDPTREVREAQITQSLPTPPRQDIISSSTQNILERDIAIEQVQEALQEANQQSAELSDQISDLKFGYNDIIGRMETFNRHMQNLHTAIASLREAATPLLNKSKCE